MKYSIISTLEYGKGRIILMCCRFNNAFTGNYLLSQSFSRVCLQWAASETDESILDVATVVNSSVNGGGAAISSLEMTNSNTINIEDLSEYSSIQNMSCIVIFGIDNNISPVIRNNLVRYVDAGGGLILSDINVTQDYILLLNDFSSVYSVSSGVNFSSGKSVWTETGILSYIFQNGKYSDIDIPPLNTIQQSGLGSSWQLLYAYDTDQIVENPVPPPEIEGTVYISNDYDISGAYLMGYYASPYKYGQFDAKNS